MPFARERPFDPPAALLSLRGRTPLCRLRYPDGHEGWLVIGYGLAREVLSSPQFSARSDLKRVPVGRPGAGHFAGRPPMPGWLVDMDQPDHTRIRKLVGPHFTIRRLARLRPRVEAVVAERIAHLRRCGPPADLVQEFALPVPSSVICELLGVPYESRAEFQRNSRTLFSLEVDLEEADEAMRQLDAYLLELARRKRRDPDEDLLSELATEGTLADEEIAGLGVLLLTAGHETSASMLSLGTFALLRERSQWAALCDHPELVDDAVEELLRYLTIFQFGVPRTPLEDVELGGLRVRAGESVTVLLPLTNRDPERFDAPDVLDVGRRVRGHLAFGFGIHQCLGQNLARLELRAGYLALCDQLPTLRLAVPAAEIPLADDLGFYGAHRLPVTW
ncbi:cytochrome P450 [Actinophytocola sp.]|uniref:cytochrome P450 n=1 Tax=Actinophytocola sp. TaxID=1872138 RepID=UPI002F94FF2D